jgi:putative ABC transport system substrate-binding protein
MEAFREGLREVGYVEGQNIDIDLRYAGDPEHLRQLSAELIRANINVLATFGDVAPRIAQHTTTTIPIVALADDILGTGLITNLARPGANITGISILSPELSAKRLELLREIVPQASRVAVMWDPATPSQLKAAEGAARSLRIKLQVLEVRGRADLAGAFQAATQERAEALNVLASPMLSSLHQAIIDGAARSRLPVIYQWKEHAEAGGLVSYGPSVAAMWRQTAHVVSKILKGARPTDLPVEQPAKFELVINLRTARSLGLKIPQALSLRADLTIE